MAGRVLRHYCGQLIRVEVFQSHGEIIPKFFNYVNNAHIVNCPNCSAVLDTDWCGSPWLVEPMDDNIAQYTSTNKYCSNCWGYEFQLVPAKDLEGNYLGMRVICVSCQEETIGYVSEQYIRRQQSEDYIHYRKDINGILQALGLPIICFTSEKQNLKELGF